MSDLGAQLFVRRIGSRRLLCAEERRGESLDGEEVNGWALMRPPVVFVTGFRPREAEPRKLYIIHTPA